MSDNITKVTFNIICRVRYKITGLNIQQVKARRGRGQWEEAKREKERKKRHKECTTVSHRCPLFLSLSHFVICFIIKCKQLLVSGVLIFFLLFFLFLLTISHTQSGGGSSNKAIRRHETTA